jgi:lipopolysaccharide/colanic/teichoic acid biosynthesis glycosyltransferase
MYRKFLKRVFDIFSSGAVILVLLPFFIVFTPVVALCIRGNPFFVQRRPGKDCKIFNIIKYRTMNNKKDESGNLLPDDLRLTRFGKFMRSMSIDELPELFNIFVGNMSVVGPRPLLIKDMIFFDEEILRRQNVRPGLTGYAQVNGRNNVTWEEKFQMDLEYISRITFWKDMKIIFKTIGKVLGSDDIATDGMATAEDYGDYLLRTGKIDNEAYKLKIEEMQNEKF